jgi:hypothetical protein
VVAVEDQQVRAGQDRPAAREVERLLDYYEITDPGASSCSG